MELEAVGGRPPVEIQGNRGLIAASGDFLVHASGDLAGLRWLRPRLDEIQENGSWSALVRAVATSISERGFDEHPAVACFSFEPDLVRAFVFGDLEVEVESTGERRTISGRGTSTWVEVNMVGRLRSLSCGWSDGADVLTGRLIEGIVPASAFRCTAEAGYDGPLPERPDDEAMRPALTSEILAELGLQLRDQPMADVQAAVTGPPDNDAAVPKAPATRAGTDGPAPDPVRAPATGLAARPGPVASSPSGRPASAAQSDAASDDETDMLRFSDVAAESVVPSGSTVPGEPDPAFEPPMVRGVHCPAGHLGSMQDRRCRRCGAAIAPGQPLVQEPRPSLGLLLFDDGVVVDLVQPVVIGRGAPEHHEIDGVPAQAVSLREIDRATVSRLHLEVRLTDWTIALLDHHSSNGSYTRRDRSDRSRVRLPAGQLTPVEHGTYVDVGDRWFLVTSRSEL